jgi:Zn-dependent protease
VLLGVPQQTNFDLHFRLLGIPVRVHPMFWLLALFLGGLGQNTPPKESLIWVLAVFVSVVVHEMGHALVAKHYGWPARIVLYWLGGLAQHESNHHDPKRHIILCAAGPGAGFLFAALILGLGMLAQFPMVISVPFSSGILINVTPGQVPSNLYLFELVKSLLIVNIYWGVLNLMPVLPLDGGQITRELLILWTPRRAIYLSFMISMVTAGAIAIFGVMQGILFMAVLFGFMAYSSYSAWQSTIRGDQFRSEWN